MIPFLGLTVEQTQYIGWGVAILSSVLVVVLGRKVRPAEKATLDLQALTAYREALENQVESLRNQVTDITSKLQTTTADLATAQAKIDTLLTENERLKGKDEANAKLISSLQDRLLESQVISQIMKTQRDKIIRQFNLPTSVGDIKD